MFSAIKRRLNFRELLRHGRRSENEDIEPRPFLDHCALAHKFNTYDQDRFPLTQYDVNIDQKYQVDAFTSALRVSEEADLTNFTFQVAHEHPDAEEGTLVPTVEDLDFTTLGEWDHTSSNINTMKPVDLMSLEEIFADESEVIPALLIRYTDIVGSDRLAYKHDAAIYYDFCVDQIEHHVSSRGVMVLPRVPDQDFFCRHAVRVFLQVPDIPDIINGPFYRYMGDYYIVKTDQLLPRHEWIALPEFLKERFVKRFVETQNRFPRDGFRAQNHYTWATTRELLDRGNIYPLIVLMQAWKKEEPVEPCSPVRLNGTELLFLPPASPKSFKSVSNYSQESACEDEEYDSKVGNFPSPLFFTDPFGGGGNVILTFPNGEQEIYTASRAAFAYNPEDYAVNEDTSNDRLKYEDWYLGNNYNADDYGGEGSDNNGGEEGGDSCKVQDTQSTSGDFEEPSWFDDEAIKADGPADAKHSGKEISESDRVMYAELKMFCEELEETSDPDTALGRLQRQFIYNQRAEMAALGL